MNARLQKLLTVLPTGEYITAETLSNKLGMGVKTVRVKIAELNSALVNSGGRIISRQRYGYQLEIQDDARFAEFLRTAIEVNANVLPSTPDERIYHILQLLVENRKFLRLDDIADAMYISKASISNDIKRIEEILEGYSLFLERKPHYGIRIAGKERRIRRMIVDYIEKGEFAAYRRETFPAPLNTVSTVIEATIKKHALVFHKEAYERLCMQVFVSMNRITRGFTIEPEADNPALDEVSDGTLLLANELAEMLGCVAGIPFPKGEVEHIIMQLQGKRTIGAQQSGYESFPVTGRIQDMVTRMLDDVYTEFGVDLRGDLDLRLSLGMHLLPFDFRMKYDMTFQHPEAKSIQEHYPFAYTVAAFACASLQPNYEFPVPSGEIAYITPFFALAMEKNTKSRKKRVLLVCATGKASSQLLAYRFREQFSDYLEEVEVIDQFSLSAQRAQEYDYVFTTVPLSTVVSRPVFEFSQFLLQDEISRLRTILSRSENTNAQKWVRPELFFADIVGKDRLEIISLLCSRIAEVYPLPVGFEDAVLEREQFFSTDYGNLVAFPHPMMPLGDETFASVAVLEKPILWGRNPVQVVLLVSIEKTVTEPERLQEFYGMMADLIANEKGIRTLIAKPTYDTLMGLLE